MNAAGPAPYLFAFLPVFALAASNMAAFRRLKAKAGTAHACWSGIFHLGFVENLLVLGLLLAVAAWGLALIALKPESPEGYRRLLLLAFGLSLAPRRNAVIGNRGIVYRMRYVPWSSIRNMSYSTKKSRVKLRLLYETSPGSDTFEAMIIPLPRDIDLNRPLGPI
ncbi:MAG: hypothetical protein JW747_02205 [Candidatus Aminicenantes bacterium]|nr:hypothetical protein [Candidatus Aminicenantes bacterium]